MGWVRRTDHLRHCQSGAGQPRSISILSAYRRRDACPTTFSVKQRSSHSAGGFNKLVLDRPHNLRVGAQIVVRGVGDAHYDSSTYQGATLYETVMEVPDAMSIGVKYVTPFVEALVDSTGVVSCASQG